MCQKSKHKFYKWNTGGDGDRGGNGGNLTSSFDFWKILLHILTYFNTLGSLIHTVTTS